jgi:hypothetical protein
MLRVKMFLKRAGTTIFSMMVLIWFLASFPRPPAGATGPAIDYSLAAMIGHALEPVLAPVGFNWQINVALIPGMAAREVAVAALGTVYAIEGGKEAAGQIGHALAAQWSLALRAAVRLDLCGDPPRDRQLALDGRHLRLHAGAGVSRGVRDLQRRGAARGGVSYLAATIAVTSTSTIISGKASVVTPISVFVGNVTSPQVSLTHWPRVRR